MQVRLIPNPSHELIDSLVDLEDDILPPFHQRCAVVELNPGSFCLVVLPREGQCLAEAQAITYKGMPTPAAKRHNVQRIQPEAAVAAGQCVIIIHRKDGKVLCGLMDPEFSVPKGAQLFQIASDGALNMVDLVNAAIVN
jgi:hypothetical protein